MNNEPESSSERKYDADSRVSRIRDAQRVLREVQEDIVANGDARISAVDAAIELLEEAVATAAQWCGDSPLGYDGRERSDVVGLSVTTSGEKPAVQSPSKGADEDWAPHVIDSRRAVRETWSAVDRLVAGNAPYLARLQLHVADAAFHCQHAATLRKVHRLLRGPGAAVSDTADAIATVAAMSDDICSTVDRAAHGVVDFNADLELDPDQIHYVRRTVSPYVEHLPGVDEIRSFVMNERKAAKQGRPRNGEQASKKADRLEDMASLLGLNADNADSVRRAIDKHGKAVRERVAGRKRRDSNNK